MTNKELLENIGISLKGIRDKGKTLCPECSKDRKKKNEKCLYVDVKEGIYKCYNCSFTGKVGKSETYSENQRKTYTRPPINNNTSISDQMLKYFIGRSITQKTIIKLKITEGKHYLANIGKERNCIEFNYFRGNDLINIKFRDGEKNFGSASGCERILYNLNSIANAKEATITEGEFDVAAFTEAGIIPCVSVPNGANEQSNNLDYIDNCFEYLEDKEKIIIATDNDGPGVALRNEIARRLGYERCYYIDFGNRKDANEVLIYDGIEALRELHINAKPWPIAGVFSAYDCIDDINEIFENGLQRGVTTGKLKGVDRILSFKPGYLMAVTGIPNHGKSPIVLEMAICLAINHGWKFAVYSPEHYPHAIFIVQVAEMIIGKRFKKGSCTDEEKANVIEFINDHFFMIFPEDGFDLDNILSKVKMLVLRKGVNSFILDPFNKLESLQPPGVPETTYIGQQLDQLIRFNQLNGVFTFLVVHPKKMNKNQQSQKYDIPTLYDCNGSANFYNKIDIGVCVYRDLEYETTVFIVQKMKYWFIGQLGTVEFKFDLEHGGRYYETNGPKDPYNWIQFKELAPVQPEPESLKPNLSFSDDELNDIYDDDEFVPF